MQQRKFDIIIRIKNRAVRFVIDKKYKTNV
jgi:hypothetical protein